MLWAVTSYFNPMGYARRLANYRMFRRRLGVPLVTVEWAWAGGVGYQLDPGDADILIQLSSPDLMWQKERLLNVALQSLPAECRYVAWLDCDLVFEDAEWPQRTIELLDRFPVLQMFEHAYDLEPDAYLDGDDRRLGSRLTAATHAEATGVTVPDLRRSGLRPAGFLTGLAWAARFDLLRRHGFYDACIMGSGNRALYSAIYGRLDDVMAYVRMKPRWQEHYLAWARPYYDDVRGRVGCVPGCIYHLWHGDIKLRRYAERHLDFEPFGFDPVSDLLVDAAGCFRWKADNPEMRRFVKSYFASRREDG